MTEQEWQTCTDPTPMLEYLRGKASDRKLRLFAVACCCRYSHLLHDARHSTALAVAERYADGLAGDGELAAAESSAGQVPHRYLPEDRLGKACYDAAVCYPDFGLTPGERVAAGVPSSGELAAADASQAVAHYRGLTGSLDHRSDLYLRSYRAERLAQTRLLRDIVGPHQSRLVTADPAWLTPTVVVLAEGTYQDRAFDRLPILADALQDAGCDGPDVLNHCRSDGPHVRGCWVVDLLTSRK